VIDYPPDKAEVLNEGARNLLLLAPPGCGKTEALALRAKGLIDGKSLKPSQRILALTFSNRARDNLGARLRLLLGDATFEKYMTVSNFHGFASRVYQAHAATLGLDPLARLPEKGWLAAALRTLDNNNKAVRRAEDLIRQVKLRPLTDDEVLELLDEEDPDFAAEAERMRIAEGRLDYPDLLRHAQRILKVSSVANLYGLHFGAVLVDEFQDLTVQQLDIVLAVNAVNVTLAGDPSQAIYSFAGADVEAVLGTIKTLRDVRTITFSSSFRSAPAVLTLVNVIAAGADVQELSCATPERWPDGGVVSTASFVNQDDEARFVSRLAERIMVQDPKASIGVIARAAYRRDILDERAKRIAGFPVRHWDNPAYSPDVLRVIRSEFRRVAKVPGLNEEDRFVALSEACAAKVEPTDIDLVEDTRQALAFISDVASAGMTLDDAIRSLRVSDDPIAPIGPGLHLLNAHVGKGQQFDWVIILGLEEGLIPDYRAKSPADLEEELRTLLVMTSRARHGVIATKVAFTAGMYGPRAADPSRWWDVVAGCATCPQDEIGEAIVSALALKEATTGGTRPVGV
jgi:DNA helicase II / ATP-dependent DNA helicase PcrA